MSPNPFDLEDFLPYRLSVLSNRISRVIAATYEKPFGLSIHEWRVVAILGGYPGSSATEVIHYTAMDKVTVSRAVKRLLGKGLVKRRENPGDRRSRLLHLTTRGQSIYREIIPAALEYERHILEHLDTDEQQLLDRLLRKLQSAAGELQVRIPS